MAFLRDLSGYMFNGLYPTFFALPFLGKGLLVLLCAMMLSAGPAFTESKTQRQSVPESGVLFA